MPLEGEVCVPWHRDFCTRFNEFVLPPTVSRPLFKRKLQSRASSEQTLSKSRFVLAKLDPIISVLFLLWHYFLWDEYYNRRQLAGAGLATTPYGPTTFDFKFSRDRGVRIID